jgi:hypothetical protein
MGMKSRERERERERERGKEILNKGSEISFLSGWKATVVFRTNEEYEKELLDLIFSVWLSTSGEESQIATLLEMLCNLKKEQKKLEGGKRKEKGKGIDEERENKIFPSYMFWEYGGKEKEKKICKRKIERIIYVNLLLCP